MPEKQNGELIDRIADVLSDGKVDQQTVNRLLLETMGHITSLIMNLSDRVDRAIKAEGANREVDKKEITEQIGSNKNTILAVNMRIDRLEKIVLFPVHHPKVVSAVLFVIFILMNLWFISGFRELLLEAFNAPDWLMELLVGAHSVTPAH